MINTVFATLAEELNEYLSQKLSSEQNVIISSLPPEKEDIGLDGDNVFLSLVNIEQERLSNTSITKTPDRGVSLYLYILVTAGFSESNYEASLERLSTAISFFKEKSVLTHESAPSLDSEIEKLSFEMVNLDIRELSQIWMMRGAKYYPSALYKVRIINIKDSSRFNNATRFAGLRTGLRT